MPSAAAHSSHLSLRKIAAVSVLFAFSLMARPALAASADRVSFGQRIVVAPDENAGDLVCFLCSIENHGNIQGDVVSFLGGVKSDGPVRGDVVSFLGDVSLTGNGSVSGELVVMGGDLRKSGEAHLDQDQVVFPITIFLLPLILIGAAVWGLTRLFRRRPMYFRPLR